MKRTFIFFVIAFSCLWMSGLRAVAQQRVLQYRPYIDERRFHYGFSLGMNLMDLEFSNSGYVNPETGEQWFVDVDNYSPGFSVGVLGEMKLNKYLALRLTPAIHFGQRRVWFHEQISQKDTTQSMKTTYLSIPLVLKVAAPRFNNYRPYVIAGVSPIIDLTSRRRQALRTKTFDCQIELGMGCDIYLPFFKLIPELKFCIGLADILQKDRSDLLDATLMRFTDAVNDGRSKMIVLTLNFE